MEIKEQVAVVLDLYSRLVVGWSMQWSIATQLVSDAMLMAIWTSLFSTTFRGWHAIALSKKKPFGAWNSRASESSQLTMATTRAQKVVR